MWEYDDLGLSLRFDGMELMKLSSLSIISSFYEYNGVSLIGKSLEEVRSVLEEYPYEILYYKESEEQKLLYVKTLNLIVLFDYDISTSISWDPSDISATTFQNFATKKKRKKNGDDNLKRIFHRVKKEKPQKLEKLKEEKGKKFFNKIVFAWILTTVLFISIFLFKNFGEDVYFGGLSFITVFYFLVYMYYIIKKN